ncbi:hypothetical protein PTTW11_00214 [Pyrenophora teres f. teres]|uniref:Uncharacterized protein n=1 Tax=Pyrenophora teres f. teres TaxID=97479 RepID=A0A6S6VUB0_9PLEO|nr:hypothetical protein PTTW11_00214 [Pyrenophora teres f. teres]
MMVLLPVKKTIEAGMGDIPGRPNHLPRFDLVPIPQFYEILSDFSTVPANHKTTMAPFENAIPLWVSPGAWTSKPVIN